LDQPVSAGGGYFDVVSATLLELVDGARARGSGGFSKADRQFPTIRLVSGRGYDIGAAETETERAVAEAIWEAREAYRDADADEIKKVAVRAAQQAGQDPCELKGHVPVGEINRRARAGKPTGSRREPMDFALPK
jgi:hypothetical protein